MILIGELLNASRPAVAAAIESRDVGFVQKLAVWQEHAGAAFLDVNAGGRRVGETEALCWLVRAVQDVSNLPLCVDSADSEALRAAVLLCTNRPLVNSISLEPERMAGVLPIVIENCTQVVALCVERGGLPKTAERRAEIAGELVPRLIQKGLAPEDVFIDPLVCPVAAEPEVGSVVLRAIEMIALLFPDSHVVGGVSNISFGLPLRGVLNRAFLGLAMSRGLDAAVVDVLDEAIVSEVRAAEALLGRDEGFGRYLSSYREKLGSSSPGRGARKLTTYPA